MLIITNTLPFVTKMSPPPEIEHKERCEAICDRLAVTGRALYADANNIALQISQKELLLDLATSTRAFYITVGNSEGALKMSREITKFTTDINELRQRTSFVLGDIEIRFARPLTAAEAATRIVQSSSRNSMMYKGIMAMLAKLPEDRSDFEKLVREEVCDRCWEPMDGDYEVGNFTDFEL